MTTAAYNCECAQVIIIIILMLMVTVINFIQLYLILKVLFTAIEIKMFIVVAIFKNKNVFQCVGATRHPLQFGRT